MCITLFGYEIWLGLHLRSYYITYASADVDKDIDVFTSVTLMGIGRLNRASFLRYESEARKQLEAAGVKLSEYPMQVVFVYEFPKIFNPQIQIFKK